ncbi:MAG: hypothetical protein ACJ8GJ_14220 [Vitreoscilla sp.]
MPAVAMGAAKPPAGQSDGIAGEREPFLDLMPDFWTVYAEPSSENLQERAQRLFDGFFRKHREVYRLAGVETKLDDVVRWLPGFDSRAPAAHVVHTRFASDYAGNSGRFRSALPDFDDRASPVTLLPSLMHFDAHLEPNGTSLPLFFGPDAIVYFHGADADLAVLFSHELFHCYQGQKNPAMCLDPAAPLYASLWMEGTATYASERLNPGASPLHVLLDDAALAHLDMSSRRAAAQAMLSHLDARDEATQSLFFETSHHGDGWPPRVGYAVGLQIARGLGAAMSLQQMAALPAPGVRETLAHALQQLA